MPREITDRERVVQSVKTLAPTSELFDEQNGRQKYESDLEVIVQGREYGNGKRVGPYVRLLEYDANEQIMRQGEWGGNTFYIAVEGTLDVAVADEAGGQTKIGEKTVVKKLMDDRGRYFLLSVDERRLRVHGENEGRGEVKFTPPYTMLDTARAPGKTYAMAHLIGDEPVSSEGTYYGVESVGAPAGSRTGRSAAYSHTRPGRAPKSPGTLSRS